MYVVASDKRRLLYMKINDMGSSSQDGFSLFTEHYFITYNSCEINKVNTSLILMTLHSMINMPLFHKSILYAEK